MPPAHAFVKLCKAAKIAVPPKAQHAAFLTDAGISTTGASIKDIHERCAALAWARASLASATDLADRARRLPSPYAARLVRASPAPRL
jgi:hypothetical protein